MEQDKVGCPFCGSESDRHPKLLNVKYYFCKKCRIVFQFPMKPVPHYSLEDMNKWGMLDYDKYIETMQNDLKLLDFVGSQPRRVLCFGCSAGAELKMFQDRGAEVVGYEPNPNAVKICRERGFDVYSTLKEVKGKFDLVFCREVLEHTRNPFIEFIDVIQAYMNKGAFLYVQTPYPDFDDKMGKYTYASQHYNLFPIDTLIRLFNKRGFLVKHALQSDGCGVVILQC